MKRHIVKGSIPPKESKEEKDQNRPSKKDLSTLLTTEKVQWEVVAPKNHEQQKRCLEEVVGT